LSGDEKKEKLKMLFKKKGVSRFLISGNHVSHALMALAGKLEKFRVSLNVPISEIEI